MPVVTMVREIVEDQGKEWTVKADFEHGYRIVKLKIPAVITVTRNLNQPKPLSFSGILKARNKEITEWGREALGLPADCIGLKGSPTYVTTISTLESYRLVEFLEGTLQEKVERVVQILSDVGVIL